MIRHPWKMTALLLVLAGGAFPVRAQEPAEPEIGEVVVTATRTADPVGAATKAFTVITAEEIEAKQAETVREVLRTVPGVTLGQSGGLGTVTSTFLRGSNSSHTLFLIDGIPVNSPTNGLFDLADLTTDNVERIEIVRGPQSTLYGSAAMGGVVNIITRTGRGTPTHRVRLEAGKHSTFRETVSSAGGGAEWDYAVAGSRLNSQGELAHDAYESTTLSGRIGLRPTPTMRLEFFSRFLDADKNLPPVAGRSFDPDQNFQREFTQAGASFTHAVTPAWDYKVTLARVIEETRFTNPPSGPSVTETDVDDVEFVTSFRPLPYVVLTAGGQWKEDAADTTGFSATVTDRAAYVQAQVTLLDRLTLLGSARVDDHSRFGDHGTGQVSGVYRLLETGTAFRTGYGTAFRAPNLSDLFLSFPPFFFSNPNLRPERSRTWEVGGEQRLFGGLATLSATYFYTRFTDLIQLEIDPITFTSTLENIGSARSNGVEAALGIRPVEGLTLKGTYNFTQPIDRSTGQPLLRRPKHLGTASAIYQFAGRYSLAATALFVGERPDFDPVTFATVTNGGYAKVDLAASAVLSEEWGPLRSLRLTAKIENLLDRQYDDVLGFPALGLTYLVGVEATF
ncbi:MAG: TonB-dependent receptor [candidate division NC10 bacterium]|nr:TonB-dependent receptor [candidate division NC10 bacterium]